MKSAGPWNLRGLRPQAREAAREAARQSGMSVGEWLNSVIETNGDDELPREYERQPPRDAYRPRQDRVDRDAAPVKYQGIPYRDEPRYERVTPRRDDHASQGGQSDRKLQADDEEARRGAAREEALREAAREEALREAAREQAIREAAREEALREATREQAFQETAREQALREAAREEALREAAREETRRKAVREGTLVDAAREEARREVARTRQGLGEAHARLDALTQQIDRLAHAQVTRRRAAFVPPSEAVEEREPRLTGAPPQRRRIKSEPTLSIEDAVAEISARQRALDSAPAAPISAALPGPALDLETAAPAAAAESVLFGPPAAAESVVPAPAAARDPVLDTESFPPAPAASPAPTVDFSSLEGQLRQITARIEALQPTADLERAMVAIRTDLAEIARQLNEALPRRAVESLEIEVKALAERIDHSRQSGVDPNALAGLERGLAEVHEALRTLTPAESLVGFDEAINALSQKVDMILAKDDPSALQQLEAALGGLRGVVSHVASNDTLTKVAEEVRALAAQVDGIANNAATGHAVTALEQRIDTLAAALTADGVANNAATGHAVSALEQRIDTLTAALTASSEAGHAVPRDLEKLLSGLIEKLEWVQLTHTDHAALAHLEDRIATLVSRFDASDARLGHLEAIERGLADLLVHIEQMRGINGSATEGAILTPPAARAIERDVEEIKQSERRTQESLEAVHDTVEHVVERLATIEGDLRGDRVTRATPEPEPAPAPEPDPEPPLQVALHEVALTDSTAPATAPELEPTEVPVRRNAATRAPIDPTLPPDHPLEPGFTAGRAGSGPSAADRIAASEAAIGSAKPPVIADSGRPNFIAAARRAAQAAAWEASGKPAKDEAIAVMGAPPNRLSQRLRKLIVAGAALLIVVGCWRIAAKFFDDGGSGSAPQEQSAPVPSPAVPPQAATPPKLPPTEELPRPPSDPELAAPPSKTPTTKTTKPGRQSMVPEENDGTEEAALGPPTPSTAAPPGATAMPLWVSPDITGALPQPEAAPGMTAAAGRADGIVSDKLPATIGDPALRKAATAGDPAAAYEVATRFAEGRGVPQNNAAAAHWLERAAKAGLAPAQFRLGGLYEKGIGVKKDLAVARDLYLAAAEKGNGKAMHNLAVIYAEGVAGPPDYDKAAAWFHKGADHGIRDSQYNLGILYARGIGVEHNDAESYKWFAIAAAQGDKDAAKKCDEVASRLDPQSLAAARLAVKNWTPQPQPDEAINIKPAAAWGPSASVSRAAKQD
jgi:localization factor PodJL